MATVTNVLDVEDATELAEEVEDEEELDEDSEEPVPLPDEFGFEFAPQGRTTT